MNKDEQIGRLTAIADTMARQLKQIQSDLIEVEMKIQPYHRIVSELVCDYEELRREIGND